MITIDKQYLYTGKNKKIRNTEDGKYRHSVMMRVVAPIKGSPGLFVCEDTETGLFWRVNGANLVGRVL